MKDFRIGLLKERADAIRDDLTKARKTIEAAGEQKRDLTPEEKAPTESDLKEVREIADGMAKCRHDGTA